MSTSGPCFDDVNEASRTDPMGVLVSQSQDANTYDPPGLLDIGRTYYWRVDEVNVRRTSPSTRATPGRSRPSLLATLSRGSSPQPMPPSPKAQGPRTPSTARASTRTISIP
jgi:hypothetical protein